MNIKKKNDNLGRFEIGHWYSTENDSKAIKCVIIDDIKLSLGELADNVILDKCIIKNSEFVNKDDPILILRFSEYHTGAITAFKSGFVTNLKRVGDQINPKDVICKIYPSWECPYCLSKFDSEMKKNDHEIQCKNEKLSKFSNYVPSYNDDIEYIRDANDEIKEFYLFWCAEMKKNNYLNIKNQVNYLYAYTYDIINLDKDNRIDKLKEICVNYHQYEEFTYYCSRWIADTYLLLENYKKALEYYPRIKIGKSNSERINTILNIKLKLKEFITGYEVLTLIGPQTTIWAKKHLNELVKIIDNNLVAYDNKDFNNNLIYNWSKKCNKYLYGIYSMTGMYRKIDFTCYAFSSNPEVIEFIHKISTEAENSLRERYNIPKIGEGWISETELYYKIKEYFKNSIVIHEGKPKWLGKQHLDIYFPEYNIGIEYQGKQHLEPIDFFGGKEGFEKIKKLDEKKRVKCLKNNCTLINVFEDYDIDNIINQISHEIEKQQ